mgnify:CR=1 FL=1
MSKKVKFLIETEVELQNHEDELFDVICYDGFAIAYSQKDSKKSVDLKYPKIETLTEEEREIVRAYRGLQPHTTIHIGDVMMCYGKEENDKCPVCSSENTRKDLDNKEMRCCMKCGSDYHISGEILFNARELK